MGTQNKEEDEDTKRGGKTHGERRAVKGRCFGIDINGVLKKQSGWGEFMLAPAVIMAGDWQSHDRRGRLPHVDCF